jgi:hypothetical protein
MSEKSAPYGAKRSQSPAWRSESAGRPARHAPEDLLQQARAGVRLENLGVANVARGVSILLCRDWSAILNIDARRAAALVRNPDRSE